MNFKDYQTLFMAASLVLILVAAAPTLSMVISIPNTREPFSELWILGPDHTTDYSPFEIAIGEQKQVFVGIANHMGVSTYYLVYTKFRNQTQLLPNRENSTSSPLPPLYEFRFFLTDGGIWEMPLTFTILNASLHNDTVSVERISFNDVVFNVECTTRVDSGLFYQMFFELWLYNTTLGEIQYHNRFVSIWSKLTG